MKLVINLGLSLSTLAVCLWLVWPSAAERTEMVAALRSMDVGYALACLALLPIVHFCRAWRWNNLLAPIGAAQPPGRLLAVSSVGFMAILALPARLGELVRPALIRKKGEISASAALGTVAVERVVDGLFVSLVVFFAFSSLRQPDSPGWMMPTAYAALGIFSAALVFLVCSLRWPEKTVNTAVTMTLLRHIAPRLAEWLRDKLASMIRGFVVLNDRRNLLIFVAWTAIYWAVNGLSVWVLSLGFEAIDLPVVGAYAIVGIVAVGIMLPNSPGLIGQYTVFTMLGLSLSMGPDFGLGTDNVALEGAAQAYANLLYGIQLVWYIGIGGLALTTPYVSLTEVWGSRTMDEPEQASDQTPAPTPGDSRHAAGDPMNNPPARPVERMDRPVDASRPSNRSPDRSPDRPGASHHARPPVSEEAP